MIALVALWLWFRGVVGLCNFVSQSLRVQQSFIQVWRIIIDIDSLAHSVTYYVCGREVELWPHIEAAPGHFERGVRKRCSAQTQFGPRSTPHCCAPIKGPIPDVFAHKMKESMNFKLLNVIQTHSINQSVKLFLYSTNITTGVHEHVWQLSKAKQAQ